MRRQRPGQTLQTTALANEAYLRLVRAEGIHWQDRAHFFAIAAQMMRRILVDAARSRGAAKRNGSAVRVTLNDQIAISTKQDADLLENDLFFSVFVRHVEHDEELTIVLVYLRSLPKIEDVLKGQLVNSKMQP